jgi:hypothetical protein
MSLRAPKCSYPIPNLCLASRRPRIGRTRVDRCEASGATPASAEPTPDSDEGEGLA